MELFGLAPHGIGTRLDSCSSVKYSYNLINYKEGYIYLQVEMYMIMVVIDDVDFMPPSC